jgi:hypothetical protein
MLVEFCCLRFLPQGEHLTIPITKLYLHGGSLQSVFYMISLFDTFPTGPPYQSARVYLLRSVPLFPDMDFLSEKYPGDVHNP